MISPYLKGGSSEVKMGKYLLIGALLLGVIVTFVDRGLIDNYRMKERLAALKKTNNDIARENIELERSIYLLKNDLSYIEMIARNELGMVKKGDLVFQFEK